LWDRYAGHFSPYLQRRIDALRREQASRRTRRKRILAVGGEARGGAR